MILTKIQSILVYVGLTIASMVSLIAFGKRLEKKEREVDDLKEYKDVSEAISNVDTNLTRDEHIKRLRDRGIIR